MKKDKIRIFSLQLLLIIILFFALFASNIFSRKLIAVVLLVYAIIVCFLLKKRRLNSIYIKQMNILMLIFAGIYLGVFYLNGLYFGFAKSKIPLGAWSIFNFILPLTITIISSEILRNIFLSYNLKIKKKSLEIELSKILTYILMVLIDLIIYTEVYDLTNLDDFLTAVGFVLFASLSCNLLYNYISIRYGSKSIIAYRLITILYVYIIPIVPNVYIFFRSFLRMTYPYIMYVIIEKIFTKNDFYTSYINKKNDFVGNTILLVTITLLVMLISCKFQYGILVIGSNSMQGSINKGDAVIFESYNNQIIEEGKIIVFNYNGIQTIHRVIEVVQVNGEIRYYTKGDANKSMDDGYATIDEIDGVVKLKIKYIGYPTLWLRKLFK